MTSLEQHIIELQQQIDQLSVHISTLRDLASSGQTNPDKPLVAKPSQSSTKPVTNLGINRFRQLQGFN